MTLTLLRDLGPSKAGDEVELGERVVVAGHEVVAVHAPGYEYPIGWVPDNGRYFLT